MTELFLLKGYVILVLSVQTSVYNKFDLMLYSAYCYHSDHITCMFRETPKNSDKQLTDRRQHGFRQLSKSLRIVMQLEMKHRAVTENIQFKSDQNDSDIQTVKNSK